MDSSESENATSSSSLMADEIIENDETKAHRRMESSSDAGDDETVAIEAATAADGNMMKPIMMPTEILSGVFQFVFGITSSSSHQSDQTSESTKQLSSRYPSMAAIIVFAVLSVVSGQYEFLYGILVVLWLETSWVVLQWAEYVVKDPAIRRFRKFVRGWRSFALRQTQRILHRGDWRKHYFRHFHRKADRLEN